MSGSVNKVLIIGNLTRDPELRETQEGKRIANLSVATNESWRDKQSGDKKERVEYHRVVIFNDGLAGIAKQYLQKGSKVFLEGSLATRKYTDSQGVEKYSTEVVLQNFGGTLVLLDSRDKGEQASGYSQPTAGYSQAADLTGDIPF